MGRHIGEEVYIKHEVESNMQENCSNGNQIKDWLQPEDKLKKDIV